MKPTDILKNEHRVIEQVLNCLERIADLAETEGSLVAVDASRALDFFVNFADRCHHGKEENQLFPLAQQRGIPKDGGPIGVMLMEHQEGREQIRRMRESIPGAAEGDPKSLASFLAAAREYLSLLREHIQKEDHCLFPMADRVLSEGDQTDLLASFDRVEEEDMGAGTHEKWQGIADDLAEAYGVEKAVLAAGVGGCGHHGCGDH